MPQTIYIIRHGEKQPDKHELDKMSKALKDLAEYQQPINGADASGNETPGTTQGNNSFDPTTDSLIPRGWERAGALAVLFGRMPALGGRFHQPGTIVAGAYPAWGNALAQPPIDQDLTREHRPYQTVLPLAEVLQLTIDASCQVGDEAAAMQLVLQTEGTVLVCWEHDHIFQPGTPATGLVSFLDPAEATAWPTAKWPGESFDLVWHFELVAGTDTYTWTEEYQDLLFGDTSAS